MPVGHVLCGVTLASTSSRGISSRRKGVGNAPVRVAGLRTENLDVLGFLDMRTYLVAHSRYEHRANTERSDTYVHKP